MGGLIVYSDQYKCSTIFCWKRGCLEIVGISYMADGLLIDDIIKDISMYSGVDEEEIRKLLRKLMRRQGYFTTSLKDLEDFVKEITGMGREELVISRAAAVSNII